MLHIFILLLIILFSKSQPEDSAMKEGISKTMLNSSKKLLAVRKCANCESLSNRGHVFSSSFGTRKSRVEDKFRGVEQNWQQEYPNPFNKDKDLLNGSNNKNSNHIYKSLSNTEDRFDISNIFKTSSMESDKVRMPIEPVMFGNYEWRSGFYNLLNKRDLLQDIDQYKPMFNADDKIYNKNNLEYLNHLAGTGCHSELNSVKTHALHEPSVAFYENVEGEELVSHEHDSSETELLRTKLNNGSIDQVVNESTIDTGTTEMPITSSTSKLENLIDKLINHSRYETTKSITIIPTLHQRKEEKYAVSLKTVPLYKKLLGITPKIELHQNSVPMPIGPLSCPIIKGNKIYPVRHKGGDQGNHYYHAKHSTKTSHSDLLLTEKTNPLFGHVSKTGTTPITADFSKTEGNINKALGKTIKVETNTKIDNCVVNDIRNILNQSLNF